MMFMNQYEIDDAVDRFAGHPILGPATLTLSNLADAANANSDGWAYWPKPARAAARLQTLIYGARLADIRQDHVHREPTAADYRKALVPIKAFRTRSGIDFEIVEVA